MKRVKLLVPMACPSGNHQAGHCIEVEDEVADQLVDNYHAAPVDWSREAPLDEQGGRIDVHGLIRAEDADHAAPALSDIELARRTHAGRRGAKPVTTT